MALCDVVKVELLVSDGSVRYARNIKFAPRSEIYTMAVYKLPRATTRHKGRLISHLYKTPKMAVYLDRLSPPFIFHYHLQPSPLRVFDNT